MSPLLSRILLTILLFPAAAVLLSVAYVVGWEFAPSGFPQRNRTGWIFALVVTWGFLAVSWLWLWAKEVRWTRARTQRTILAAGASAVMGGAAGFLLRPIDVDFGFFVFATVSPIIWLVLTIRICKQSLGERAATSPDTGADVVCPSCGYSLRGLRTAQCPECGSSFTLDELLDRQPGRELQELK